MIIITLEKMTEKILEIKKEEKTTENKKEEEIKKIVKRPIGRPRKYLGESKHSTKTFYYPINDIYDLVWKEFVKICNNESIKPEQFIKNEHYRTGHRLRRLLLNFVIRNTKSDIVKKRALIIFLNELNNSIESYNKVNDDNHPLLTMDELKASYEKGNNIKLEEQEEIEDSENSDIEPIEEVEEE